MPQPQSCSLKENFILEKETQPLKELQHQKKIGEEDAKKDFIIVELQHSLKIRVTTFSLAQNRFLPFCTLVHFSEYHFGFLDLG